LRERDDLELRTHDERAKQVTRRRASLREPDSPAHAPEKQRRRIHGQERAEQRTNVFGVGHHNADGKQPEGEDDRDGHASEFARSRADYSAPPCAVDCQRQVQRHVGDHDKGQQLLMKAKQHDGADCDSGNGEPICYQEARPVLGYSRATGSSVVLAEPIDLARRCQCEARQELAGIADWPLRGAHDSAAMAGSASDLGSSTTFGCTNGASVKVFGFTFFPAFRIYRYCCG
jgi:hypothetical protein